MKNIVCCLAGAIFFIGCSGSAFAQESTYVKSTEAYEQIRAAIEKIRVVDTHEHLDGEKGYLKIGVKSFFDFVGDDYNAKDKRYLDKSLSVEQRWESFKPIYERIKNGGYMKSIRLGVKKIYGIEITDVESIKKINDKMEKQYGLGIYTRILRDIGNMEFVMVQSRWKAGFPKEDYPAFFRGARVLDKMVTFDDMEDTRKYAAQYGVEIRSISDMETIYERFVEESVRTGSVGFKYSGAYLRDLDFSNPSREKAEAVLQKLLRNTEAKFSWVGGTASLEETRDLSTYLMHAMLRAIDKTGMTVAFHTGMAGDARRSDPQLLIPLFKEYKNINFDLYHSGWPYVTEYVELAKSWSNVYLNMCYSHRLSPAMARRQLSEMLECVPVNKIIAYGGDTREPVSAIGELEMAKEDCAVVLAEKVLAGYFTQAEAIEYAERLLRTNAIELYKLK